ncbi:hypothetical protein Taro_019430 [Colocasia esculenta]|uniref:Uncharacterized protein n=1 Tax=Colocasia esculenta TaxID=4460 RepID=A0A843V5G9_COLES|nr:hypothetical protein [Colocasia esculenta]
MGRCDFYQTVGTRPGAVQPLVSQVTTLHTSTGLDWSDERPRVIAMDCPQYPRIHIDRHVHKLVNTPPIGVT